MKRAVLIAVAAALLAGCSSDEETASTEVTPTTPSETTTVRVYWLRDGKVWPAQREVDLSGPVENVAGLTVSQLLNGPTEQERADLQFASAIREGGVQIVVTVDGGVALVEPDVELSEGARAQIVYTLTQFPAVESVEIDGQSYTRADFEEQTPSVLVESPLSFEEVTSPLLAEGTANTFEATFAFTITDSDGTLLAENLVTATSGTGARGTFELTESFTAPEEGGIVLTVFENSAEDGSRMNEVEIPLTVAP